VRQCRTLPVLIITRTNWVRDGSGRCWWCNQRWQWLLGTDVPRQCNVL